jgi:hypothetical protein
MLVTAMLLGASTANLVKVLPTCARLLLVTESAGACRQPHCKLLESVF